MSEAIQGLEPKHLWNYFAGICAIPHRSKEEEQLAQWIIETAAKKGFATRTDEVGNIVIDIPATAGYENSPVVILQGHIDMVCEKNSETVHDFAKDPIRLVKDGDWITADGTTLGADNGVGVAAGMAFMEKTDIIHGPLEILCTIDEETGMTGAFGLKSDFLKGRMLLNLDSEEDGAIYVGCAGGADVKLFFDISTAPVPALSQNVTMCIKGLRGGHSGLNIIENRANALRIFARLLKTLNGAGVNYSIVSIQGGSARNAIPREITGTLAMIPSEFEKAEDILKGRFDKIKTEYAKRDTDMELEFVLNSDKVATAWSENTSNNVIDTMLTVPTGVLTMSQDLPNLVESSCNLATIQSDNNEVFMWLSARSSVGAVIPEIQETIAIIGQKCGAKVELGGGYPAWQPDMDSTLLKTTIAVFEELYGKKPDIKAIHAGLECGLIGEKFDGIKMISMGPEIHGAHSPDEKILIPTVIKFWDLLAGTLTKIAKDGK
jgi:dipeptidase D